MSRACDRRANEARLINSMMSMVLRMKGRPPWGSMRRAKLGECSKINSERFLALRTRQCYPLFSLEILGDRRSGFIERSSSDFRSGN